MSQLIQKAIKPMGTSIFAQQKRFRGKINIQKPRPPHHERGKVELFVKPFISNPLSDLPWSERCENIAHTSRQMKEVVYHPYDRIIAREVLNWFNTSKMIAFFHVNSMKSEQQFEFAVPLKRANMYLKGYQSSILDCALKGTIYEETLRLVQRHQPYSLFVFSPDTDVEKLFAIAKKTPQVTVIAGILHGKLLSRNEFLAMGKLDLPTAQAGLVQVLRSAAGGDLHRQLTHHPSTLVSRLKQIVDRAGDDTKPNSDDANE